MAFCAKCGANVEDGVQFCPSCGAAVDNTQTAQAAAPQQMQPDAQQNNFGAKVAGLNNTADTSGAYAAKDVEDNKFMAVLAYLGILWLIPFFAKKDSPYVKYHCNQGLTLLIVEVGYTIISTILRSVIRTRHYIYGDYYGSYTPGWLSTILWLISIPLLIIAIIGIINAVNGKAKELPIIGKIKILK